MVEEFAEALMGGDGEAVCGARYGERSPERLNRRNGYRSAAGIRASGSIELAVPKLRAGSCSVSRLAARGSRLAKSLDTIVEDFRTRPLAGAPTRT